MKTPHLPIVYVRGYAATQGEVNDTVDDPFYGFNVGSTHVRVGAAGRPEQFIFESPLVRLMTDHRYSDVFEGDKQLVGRGARDPFRTIWIFRYYDTTADTFSHEPVRLSIEESARQLRELIDSIKEQTQAPKVHLIAHSMGGLVCRSLLQKIYPEHAEKGADHVARFFTFASPHGGIHFRSGLGFLEKLRDQLGAFNSDDFGRQRMYEYLTPGVQEGSGKVPGDFVPNQLTGFDVDNVFCAVGTNAHDYGAIAGASRGAVGPQSDGLVQIESAYVKGAHRAYVHRSHSGRYGIVNSEEAYQNLERFLFGDIQAMISLEGIWPLPDPQENSYISYQVDVQVSVRGLPVFMNEQTREHFCPIVLNDPDVHEVPPSPLFTQFLNSELSRDGRCRFAVALAVKCLRVEGGRIDYGATLHGIPSWNDTLLADVDVGDEASGRPPSLTIGWLSQEETPSTVLNPTPIKVQGFDGHKTVVSLPEGKGKELLGKNAALVIESFDWALS